MNKKVVLILALILTLFLMGSVSAGFFDFFKFGGDSSSSNAVVVEDGQYCTVNEVAAYIKEFHKLPSNYITKNEARDLGDKYIECDINANGTDRGAERIVYNTGNYRVYYTADHYNTFKEV